MDTEPLTNPLPPLPVTVRISLRIDSVVILSMLLVSTICL